MEMAFNGIPNPLREMMLSLYFTATAMALDALLTIGFKLDGTTFTFNEIFPTLNTNFGWSDYFTRRALLPLRLNEAVATGGRPAYLYRLHPLEYWMKKFHVEQSPALDITDALLLGDLATPKNYRMGLYREHLARSAFGKAHCSFPRSYLSGRLGMTRTATRSYDAALGVNVGQNVVTEAQLTTPFSVFQHFALHPESDNSRYLEISEPKQALTLRDMMLSFGGNFDVYTYRAPYIQAIALKALTKGQTVRVMRQGYNTYKLPCFSCVADGSYRGYRIAPNFGASEYRSNLNPYSNGAGGFQEADSLPF